ncbi:MAG: alpha/beta fold hydrolase [Acidimicrobiales bacterium]
MSPEPTDEFEGDRVAEPADVDGVLSWREAGNGDVVLFLHGLGGTRDSWEPQLCGLSRRWRCVAWDMPGYGASRPLTALSFVSIADAVVELLDQLGVERAHLCGLSFGGQQALHVALNHPQRVASMVLADTSAAFGADGTDAAEWKRERLAPLDAGTTPAEMAHGVIAAIAAPGFGGEQLRRTVDSFGRISASGLRAAVECLPSHDVVDRLSEIVAPTLVVVGELDHETPVEYSTVLAEGLANSRLEILEGIGHLTPAEAPDRFNLAVTTFLDGLETPPQASVA